MVFMVQGSHTNVLSRPDIYYIAHIVRRKCFYGSDKTNNRVVCSQMMLRLAQHWPGIKLNGISVDIKQKNFV